MATEKETVKAEVAADAAREEGKTSKSKKFYFRNTYYSGLSVLVRGGEDELGQLGVVHRARFTPYYDTWKGDVVRVGYLETDREDVAKLCREDSRCEEITEKEYTEAVTTLRKAPIPQA